MSPAQRKPPRPLLLLYGALAATVISGLAYWLLGSRQDSKLDAVRGPSKTDATMDRAVPMQEPLDAIGSSPMVYSDPAPLKLTDAERKASNQILSQLQQDLNAIEIANAEVIYQMDNEFVQETYVQIAPPEPEQLTSAWESFMQRLAATKLRDSVAGKILAKAQYMEKNYYGRRDLPFRVMHSFRAKAVKDSEVTLGARAYEQKPGIRFTEHGSSFLSSDSGGGEMQAVNFHKKENWERYGHLFRLMPELSGFEDPRAKKSND